MSCSSALLSVRVGGVCWEHYLSNSMISCSESQRRLWTCQFIKQIIALSLCQDLSACRMCSFWLQIRKPVLWLWACSKEYLYILLKMDLWSLWYCKLWICSNSPRKSRWGVSKAFSLVAGLCSGRRDSLVSSCIFKQRCTRLRESSILRQTQKMEGKEQGSGCKGCRWTEKKEKATTEERERDGESERKRERDAASTWWII